MARLDAIRAERAVANLALQLDEAAGPMVAFEGEDEYDSMDAAIADFEAEAAAADAGEGSGSTEQGRWAQTLLRRPKQLGTALRFNKLDKRDSRMQMGLHLFEPIRVYFSLLQWPARSGEIALVVDTGSVRGRELTPHVGGPGESVCSA